MMRLVKDASNELGIIISSKKNVANGMTGYSIAHIEPNGLIDRWEGGGGAGGGGLILAIHC